MVQMDRSQEFDYSVSQKFKSFIVGNVGFRLLFFTSEIRGKLVQRKKKEEKTIYGLLPQPRHDVDQSIDATFSSVHIMNTSVAVLWLTDTAVGQRITGVIWVGTKIFTVRRVCKCQLQQVSIFKTILNSFFKHIQRLVET